MSYVQPSGTIQLFRWINLDNRYMHTLYFPNVATQTSFFDGLVDNSLSFVSQSYSRPNKKSVRVKINAESCQDVSYMRFNNRGNKWYYAFVLAINYINENTTDIVYEIDVMQTWFMGGSSPQDMINPCMVLREHVTNDTFGLNLEPEPIGSDVYDMSPEITNEAITEAFNGFAFVLCTTGEPTETNMIKDGIVNGTTYTSLPAVSGNMSNLKTYMENALGSWDKQEQKEDIQELTSIFKDMMNKQEVSDGTEYIHELMEAYTPETDFRAVYKFVISDKKKPLIVDIGEDGLECYYGNLEDVDVVAKTTPEVFENIIQGRITFQRAFMAGDMTAKGNFKLLRMLDVVFPFGE